MVIETKVKKIDGDTHFFYSPDFKALRELLPPSKQSRLGDMMWRDAERFANPNGVRVEITGEGAGSRNGAPDPARDPEARLKEMDRLGFDMQVLDHAECPAIAPAPGLRQASMASNGPRSALQQFRSRPTEPLPRPLHPDGDRALG